MVAGCAAKTFCKRFSEMTSHAENLFLRMFGSPWANTLLLILREQYPWTFVPGETQPACVSCMDVPECVTRFGMECQRWMQPVACPFGSRILHASISYCQPTHDPDDDPVADEIEAAFKVHPHLPAISQSMIQYVRERAASSPNVRAIYSFGNRFCIIIGAKEAILVNCWVGQREVCNVNFEIRWSSRMKATCIQAANGDFIRQMARLMVHEFPGQPWNASWFITPKQSALMAAFCMGLSSRLGADSFVRLLPPQMVRLILETAFVRRDRQVSGNRLCRSIASALVS